MSHNTRNYSTLMRTQGFRVTPQRQLILDAICAGAGHAAPDEIYRRVSAQLPAVNRATVYRNLDFLCRMRLVTCVDTGGGRVYEIATEKPHHHLVCRHCGGVEQLEHDLVKTFFARIARERQFAVDTDHLALFGLCRKCQKTAG